MDINEIIKAYTLLQSVGVIPPLAANQLMNENPKLNVNNPIMEEQNDNEAQISPNPNVGVHESSAGDNET